MGSFKCIICVQNVLILQIIFRIVQVTFSSLAGRKTKEGNSVRKIYIVYLLKFTISGFLAWVIVDVLCMCSLWKFCMNFVHNVSWGLIFIYGFYLVSFFLKYSYKYISYHELDPLLGVPTTAIPTRPEELNWCNLTQGEIKIEDNFTGEWRRAKTPLHYAGGWWCQWKSREQVLTFEGWKLSVSRPVCGVKLRFLI